MLERNRPWSGRTWFLAGLMIAAIGCLALPGTALAQDGPTGADAIFTASNLWIMIAGMLVFTMHLGFATLESGLTRGKNTVNILFKNAMIVCLGLLTYWIMGFKIMYPRSLVEGTGAWILEGVFAFGMGVDFVEEAGDQTIAYGDYTRATDFFFQAMFAATAATIVSGAVAERIKLNSFLIFASIFVMISYPITGSWQWGGGWLATLGNLTDEAGNLVREAGFYDFAGSTLVHAVGGTGALVMVLLLGPRLGKYSPDGTSNPIPGHNLPLAAIGVFILWFGWFGFNGGSVLSADPAGVSMVIVTTSMAAAAGGVAAAIISAIMSGKPDLTMALNGILAGLVGITAGADQMAIWESVVIGLVAGAIVYFAVIFIDKIRIDDPVGAISVHLVCGVWGTLAVGIFGAKGLYSGSEVAGKQLLWQAIGVGSIVLFTAVFVLVVGGIIKAVMGLRVSDAEQIEGLDLGEHDMAAYPDFQPTFIKSYHLREA